MAFVVEDGTGKTDATSFVSVADADTYFEDRGNTTWAIEPSSKKQQALITATQYVEACYQWAAGVRTSRTQSLSWPRLDAVDNEGYYFESDEIPQRVKDAVCELAVRALSETLLEDTTQKVLSEAIAFGVSVTYDPNSPQSKQFALVDRILAPLVMSGVMGQTVRG